MEYLTTDKEGIKILIEVLKEKGIRQVVLSPGSRNAPLLVAFAREKQIRHFVVLDERSAAFMALGMAQQSGVPVALVCTSGTAPLNYAPAIAEAYYQRLPLIVITADRPVEWIDQDDSQTIRQQAVFRNIVKASYQLPAELFHADEHWYANRLVNDALNTALKGRQGPVHLNIPLRESLYGLRDYPEREVRTIECIDPAPSLSVGVMQRLVDIFDHCPKVMILAGFHRPDFRLREALHRLAGYPNVVVYRNDRPGIGNGKRGRAGGISSGVVDYFRGTVDFQACESLSAEIPASLALEYRSYRASGRYHAGTDDSDPIGSRRFFSAIGSGGQR